MRGSQLCNMKWPCIALVLVVAVTATYADNGTRATVNSGQKSENGKSSTERVDLNKTISEVEKILDNYPELPRIDRSEILSILQNMTEEDNEKLKEELTGVLEEEKQKMQSSEQMSVVEQIKNNKSQENKSNGTRADGNRSVMVVLPFRADDGEESLEELYTRSPIVVMEEQKEVEVTTYSPKFDVSSLKRKTEPPTFSIIEKEDTKFNPPLRVIGLRYHTTPGPNYHSSEDSSRSYTNFQDPEQVTMAFRTQEVKESHLWNHKGMESTTEETRDIVSAEDSKEGVWDDQPPVKPEGSSQTFHEPDAMDNFSLEDAVFQNTQDEVEEPNTVRNIAQVAFTSPETTTAKVYITTYKPKRKKTTTEETFWSTVQPTHKKKYKPKGKPAEKTTKAPIPQDLANMLDNLPPHMKEMLSNIGINDGLSFSATEVPTIPPPVRSVNPHIDPASFHNFKPLPLKRQKTITEDMQQFLASFGLLEGNRQQKAAVETTTPFNDKFLESAPRINPDFLTDTMKKTLDSLGLYDRPTKKQSRHIFNPKNLTAVQSDEELKKLNALLTTIKKLASLNDSEPVTPEFQKEILEQVKELDNITISYKTSAAINEEIHKIMERNKGKFKIPVIMKESSAENTLQEGLNPEFYEEIQLKNEVKRQENSTSEDSSSTTEGSSTTEPANSAALEDAFGGGDTAPADSKPEDSLPPRRPNGLYLLLDWNTFFEVGTEDDARRVNIRFQPKIGDGRNFLPVSIP